MIEPRCSECPLNGKKVLPTTASKECLMIIGEAPGRDEERQGKPFIGPSGKLLRAALSQTGLTSFDQVWFTNVVMCRPDSGAPPMEAIQACLPRLQAEVAAAQPKTILLLGATALSVFRPTWTISQDRGTVFVQKEGETPTVPTWHPAAVLRDPGKFRDFAYDLQKAVDIWREGWRPEEPHIDVFSIKTPIGLIGLYKNLRRALPLKGTLILDGRPVGVCDLETSQLDPFHPEARTLRIGIAFSPDIGYSIYPSAWESSWKAFEYLKRMLESSRMCWVGHNAIFDAKWLLHHHKIDWQFSFDTMLAHYCTDERPWGHGLKRVSRQYFQAKGWKDLIIDALGGDKKRSFAEVPDLVLDEYLGDDLHYTYRLIPVLLERMLEEDTKRVHDNLLIPASHAFRDIELRGILVDAPYLHSLETTIEEELSEVRSKLAKGTDQEDFNPNSHVQVAKLVYDILGKPVSEKRTTAKDVLAPWAKDEPLIQAVLDYRQKSKVLSTYVRGLLKKVGPDGRVRSNFRVFGTATGRLSSSAPNLQNIPIVMGPQIRRAFVAPEGWLLIDVDYSQLELRILAYYSQDEALIQAYQEDRDIHTFVASMMYNVPEEEVTKVQRYWAKYVDFGVLYGRGALSLTEDLHCSVREAQEFIDRFLGLFPGVQEWIRGQHSLVLERGSTVTPTGRRRRFPLIMPTNRGHVLRQSVNSPIQGLASDVCLSALIRLHQALDPETAHILLTVHDSIMVEVREEVVEKNIRLVREIMEGVQIIDSPVPFKVGIDVGKRWGNLSPV